MIGLSVCVCSCVCVFFFFFFENVFRWLFLTVVGYMGEAEWAGAGVGKAVGGRLHSRRLQCIYPAVALLLFLLLLLMGAFGS